jgi:hypothetical protein
MNGESRVLRASELSEDAAGLHRGKLIFAGFDGGAAGNTEKMIYKTPERPLDLAHGIDI